MVIEVYKCIYRNVIQKQEELVEKTKSILEADKVIHTTYIDEPKEYSEKIKQRFKRQRASIERLNRK